MNNDELIESVVRIFNFSSEAEQEVLRDLKYLVGREFVQRLSIDPAMIEFSSKVSAEGADVLKLVGEDAQAKYHYQDSVSAVLADWIAHLAADSTDEQRERARQLIDKLSSV